MELEKNRSKSSEDNQFHPSVGDIVSLGTKGLFKIEQLQSLDVNGESRDCLVAINLNQTSTSKMFIPFSSHDYKALRLPVNASDIRNLESSVQEMTFDPFDLDKNSNTKMKAYDERIRAEGFHAMVNSYFCIKLDLEKTKRLDKRYVLFNERLKELITFEMAYVLGVAIETTLSTFEGIENKLMSH